MIIDVFNHLFPRNFYDRYIDGPGALPDIGKRVRNVPTIVDLDARFKEYDQKLRAVPTMNVALTVVAAFLDGFAAQDVRDRDEQRARVARPVGVPQQGEAHVRCGGHITRDRVAQYLKLYISFLQVLASFLTFHVTWPGLLLSAMSWIKGTLFLDVVQLPDRKSTRLNSSHTDISRMPSSA